MTTATHTVRIGDKLIVTPRKGNRFGVQVNHVYTTDNGNVFVGGRQFRVSDPTVFFTNTKIASIRKSDEFEVAK